MKRLLIVTILLGLAVPAAFAVPPAGQGPEALCKQQRNTIGMAAFRDLYALGSTPKAAMDACLSVRRDIAAIAAKNAAKACKAEQAANPTTFASTYGKNENDKNAFGKCVSAKSKEAVEDSQQRTLNAAKKCKADRAANATAFKNTHGTNKNKSNAFGKCVSKYAKQQGTTP